MVQECWGKEKVRERERERERHILTVGEDEIYEVGVMN